jgi:hypothetical protein
MAKVERAALAFVVALVMCASCNSSSGGGGGETHWLYDCGTDADCGGRSLSCRCGVCTRGCQGDGDCRVGSRAATCFATASPGVVRRCGSDVAGDSPGICLNVCNTSSDCLDGEACVAGKCTAAEQDAAPPTPNDIAGKYTRVDAGVDFEEEVTVPEPRQRITGLAAAQLAGTWVEVEDDGSPCNPKYIPRPPSFVPYVSCGTLVIEANASGVQGSIFWQATDTSAIPSSPDYPTILGPFEPVKDASRGYPEGVDPVRYVELGEILTSDVSYRVLDGVFSDGRLSFWNTGFELWREWCALQTPFPFLRGGTRSYRCVPQDANETNTDVGKLALCTTGVELGLCDESWDCACLNDSVLCKGTSMCSCTAKGCGVQWRSDYRIEADVDLEQGVMHVRQENGKYRLQFVMHRVSP